MTLAAALVLGGWVVLASVALRRTLRHSPRRVAELAEVVQPRSRRERTGPLTALGRVVRVRLLRRPDPVSPLDRWVGAAVAIGAALVLAGHPLLAVLVGAGLGLHGWRQQRLVAARTVAEADRALPDLIDLLAVAVGAGCTAERALRAVEEHAPAPFQSALTSSVRRLDRGATFLVATEPLAAACGTGAGSLAHLLVSAHLDGVALGPALERLGDEARRRRRLHVQEAARRLPVRLLLPLVLCTLPAFALLTVVPVLLATLGRLH